MNRLVLLGIFSVACVHSAYAQVFTQAEGAVEGIATQGEGQALYGAMGLNSAVGPEYQIYRKYNPVADDFPLSTATNVEGNAGEIEWTDVNQRQQPAFDGLPKNVLTAPGMFIGQKNHTTEAGWVVSNPDEILYFKPLKDNQQDLALNDTNRYAFWGTRFGFMENPDDFLDFVEPNSEQLDLWTGQFNTDAVYLQNTIERDDSVSEEVLSRVGGGGSFFLQSGDPATEIVEEQNRDPHELTRMKIGTDEEVARVGFVDAGVAYEDPVEVTWGMKLADPDATDDIEKRTVEFWVKVGNVIASGQFDPGAEGNPPFDPPNPGGDFFSDYTDGYFDWRNAKPVFYAGARNGVAGTGAMGIFVPGDFGADGTVNLDDFQRLAAYFGEFATTYSRGDFTQDGITDLEDLTAWSTLAESSVKSDAVAAIQADVTAGGSLYDFDGSGATDAADVDMIAELFGVEGGGKCTPGNGDIDGNGKVEFADFLILSGNFGQEADQAGGDIDCSGKVDFGDFLVLSGSFGQDVGQASAVPEPRGMVLFGAAMVVLLAFRRTRMGKQR